MLSHSMIFDRFFSLGEFVILKVLYVTTATRGLSINNKRPRLMTMKQCEATRFR